MPSGRDPGTPEGSGERPARGATDDHPHAAGAAGQPGSAAFTDADFIGPLGPADQAWSEHTLRADTSAALFEPVDTVIRRREAHIGGLYRMATLLTLTGDLAGGGAAGFRAIAESRALAEFMAASPAYCLDCFLLGARCQRHQPGEEVAAEFGSGEARPGGGSAGSQPGGGGSASSRSAGGRTAGASGTAPGTGRKAAGHQPGHEPEWRRFGADEFPSASG